jgi:type IV pilus assembly protein PilC
MIIVGEKSGSLENVLNDIGKYYAQEVEDDLKNITQIIEPILILVVGILVGLMVISIIAPIYQLVGSLQIS